MALVDRLKGILLEPKNEWPKIAAETATPQSIYANWVCIFAAIGPLALLLVAAFAHDLSEMLFAALLFAAGLTGFVGLGTIAYALLLRPSSSDE